MIAIRDSYLLSLIINNAGLYSFPPYIANSIQQIDFWDRGSPPWRDVGGTSHQKVLSYCDRESWSVTTGGAPLAVSYASPTFSMVI